MNTFCADCGASEGHQLGCPMIPFPSELIEQQITPDQTPRERYETRREMERFIKGEKKI